MVIRKDLIIWIYKIYKTKQGHGLDYGYGDDDNNNDDNEYHRWPIKKTTTNYNKQQQ